MAKRRVAHVAAELIVANAPDPVFVCDPKGKLLVANKAVSQLLGLRRDELLKRPLSPFLRTDTNDFQTVVRDVVERGVTRNVRLRLRTASGTATPTSLNASALRDPGGKVIAIIGILRDIRRFDQARSYAESLIKNAPDPVFVSDLDGKILLLGFRRAELIEQSLSRIISADGVPRRTS